MSLWKIGADDVSEEAQHLKDTLASKDSQIAGQQTQLMKQAEELGDVKASLEEALRKLGDQAQRVLTLERELTHCKEDLMNEKNNSGNTQTALDAANAKIKAKDTENRDLEAALDRLSSTSNDHNSRSRKLEHDKSVLESRIREMESTIRQLQSTAAANTRRPTSRSSSAQFHDLKIVALEKEILALEAQVTSKDGELTTARGKLLHSQDGLLRTENEMIAAESKFRKELKELRDTLQEREEDLGFYKNQMEDGARETELLQRIDEDTAKITALEKLYQQGSKGLENKLKIAEEQLKGEKAKVSDLELRNIELVREKEDVLNHLALVQSQLQLSENQVDMNKELAREVLHDGGQEHGSETVAHVERLLVAIERLRGERNDLRRSLEFLEVEHKFAVEALEKRMTEVGPSQLEAVKTASALESQVEALQIQLLEVRSSLDSKDKQLKTLARSAATFAILLSHSQERYEHSLQQAMSSLAREHEAWDRLDVEIERSAALEEEVTLISTQLKDSEEKYKEMEIRLEDTVSCLENTTSQLDEAATQLRIKEGEWEELSSTWKCLQERLGEAEEQLEDMSRTLELVESERDSLSLQVTNLIADLQISQDELANAENRYSNLQFHQLSNMTSSEATLTLREQIEELEGRVMRRTEQIGVHQHDIRRLETNLRLQEDRLAEMTTELETLAAQKAAMVEDCADAREARDEALRRVDDLEEEMELMESKLADNDDNLKTLTCVLVQTAAGSKTIARRAQDRIRQAECDIAYHQAAHNSLRTHLVDADNSNLDGMRQVAIALALTQVQFKKAITRIQGLMRDKTGLVEELDVANKRCEEQQETNACLSEECMTLRQGSTATAELAARTSESQVQIDQLKKTVAEVRVELETAQTDVIRSAAQAKEAMEKEQIAIVDKKSVESHLTETRRELESLLAKLSTLETTLEEERASREVAETRHAEVLAKSRGQLEELRAHVDALQNELAQMRSSQEDLSQEKEKSLRELNTLHSDLENVLEERAKARKEETELRATNGRLCDEVSALQKKLECAVAETESQTGQHQQELQAQVSSLQSEREKLTQSLKETMQQVQHLSQELEQERQATKDAKDCHSAETEVLLREQKEIQSKVSVLQDEITTLKGQLHKNTLAINSKEEEKDQLQEVITGLEAQIQKSKSYAISLDRQIVDGQRSIEALKRELSKTQDELSRSQTSAKTAEMNLSLQSAQFKRELAQMQDKLNSLESQPDLESTLAELKERNDEMEELLKAKCAEIEDNDDRSLEMLKENKKLGGKVETLSRKVQNLQTKLAAAKATATNSQIPAVDVPKPLPKASTNNPTEPRASTNQPAELRASTRRRSSGRTTTTQVLPSSQRASPQPNSATQSTSRTTSGPLAVRTKTPERKTHAPVFKLRTPEQPRVTEQLLEPPTSIVGVKRRAPDDFEVCESVPPQGFMADGKIPLSRENESTTPRVRRMINNLQSGFTPIRNKISPSKRLSPSKRQTLQPTSSHVIQDVTNSPRTSVPADVAKQSKRGWLGKIRGTSTTQAHSARPTSRPVFTLTDNIQ